MHATCRAANPPAPPPQKTHPLFAPFTPRREERDPRWVVQNREDGKNVGGWHWEEKNVLAWARQELEGLLTAIPAAAEGAPAIRKLKTCTGEVRLAKRSGGQSPRACG